MHTRFPRLLLAGSHSGSGKTTLALSLMRLLARQGYAVAPFKVGPDYIDPAFHKAAAGNASRNLDPWLLPPATLRRLFCMAAAPETKLGIAQATTPEAAQNTTAEAKHLALIEGVMGMYDGLGTTAECSSAHVAGILQAPVVLVVNAEGISLSAAALVQGFANFRPASGPDLPPCTIAGVILNRVSSPMHYTLLKGIIEEHANIPCLGFLRKNAVPPLPHRHLGLVPAEEQQELHSYLEQLANAAEESLDLQALVRTAANASLLPEESDGPEENNRPEKFDTHSRNLTAAQAQSGKSTPARIGIAKDKAFTFYYQDALDALEEAGAELVPFSPLQDSHLPERLDGLYLGGGFPETFAPELEANGLFRAELKEALESGLPAYAECGGMLYLCSSLACPDPESGIEKHYAMVDFFPEQAEMTTKLQPFGYVTGTFERDTVLGPAGTSFPAHEFHYSRILSGIDRPAATVRKKDGRNWQGGLIRKNVLGMYPHLHFAGSPELAEYFLTFCLSRRNTQE